MGTPFQPKMVLLMVMEGTEVIHHIVTKRVQNHVINSLMFGEVEEEEEVVVVDALALSSAVVLE